MGCGGCMKGMKCMERMKCMKWMECMACVKCMKRGRHSDLEQWPHSKRALADQTLHHLQPVHPPAKYRTARS